MLKKYKHNDSPPEETKSQDEGAEAVTPEQIASLQRKAAECDELTDRVLRMRADFENSRKRLERGMQERADYAIEKFAGELLPVADNLARAIEAAQHHDTLEQILEGVQLVEKQLYDALAKHGITPITTEPGQPFDHNLHEALSTAPAPGQPANTIIHVIQHGFMIHQRLLRPAKVIVSAELETRD